MRGGKRFERIRAAVQGRTTPHGRDQDATWFSLWPEAGVSFASALLVVIYTVEFLFPEQAPPFSALFVSQ